MRSAAFAALALVLATGAARADSLTGEVTTLNPDMNAMSVRRDGGDALRPDVRVLADNLTSFSGVGALSELRVGDFVDVSGRFEAGTGNLVAESVSLAPEHVAVLPSADSLHQRDNLITDDTILGDRSSLMRRTEGDVAPVLETTPETAPAAEERVYTDADLRPDEPTDARPGA